MNIIHDAMFSSNEHRLAQALLIQMQLQEAVSLQLTYDTLAYEPGAAYEAVPHLLKQSRGDGLLQQSGGCITILDKQQLTRL